MARVEVWASNGDTRIIDTNDPDVIAALENAPFDESSNIDITRVTEDG